MYALCLVHCRNQGARLQKRAERGREREKEKHRAEKNKKEKTKEPPLAAEALEEIY